MPSNPADDDYEWIDATNEAFLTRLRDHPVLVDKVFSPVQDEEEGDPSPLPLPYVMVFADTGTHRSDRQAQQSENALFNYTLHVVGDSKAQINYIMACVAKQLVNWRPVVPGRTCWKLTHNFSTPYNTRDDMRPPLGYIVDEWALMTTRGTET